uniref:SnoaL-like domain-containing protein n=2 Tax=Opuntia streptacantha TaxID=393608 RepID=A0A7C9CJV9_OPUST
MKSVIRTPSSFLSESRINTLRVSTTLFLLSAVPKHSRVVMDQASQNKQRWENDASKGSQLYSDQIMPHILNLYGACAKAQDFEIYVPHATFEDPLMCAHGVKQIKSAFYSLSKVFSESSIVEYTIDEKVTSPGKNQILIDNKQHYKFLGRDIDMISLIVLSLEDGKVVRHEDRWNKKPLLNRETVRVPVVGRLIEVARRGSMLATHALMGFGKDPSP